MKNNLVILVFLRKLFFASMVLLTLFAPVRPAVEQLSDSASASPYIVIPSDSEWLLNDSCSAGYLRDVRFDPLEYERIFRNSEYFDDEPRKCLEIYTKANIEFYVNELKLVTQLQRKLAMNVDEIFSDEILGVLSDLSELMTKWVACRIARWVPGLPGAPGRKIPGGVEELCDIDNCIELVEDWITAKMKSSVGTNTALTSDEWYIRHHTTYFRNYLSLRRSLSELAAIGSDSNDISQEVLLRVIGFARVCARDRAEDLLRSISHIRNKVELFELRHIILPQKVFRALSQVEEVEDTILTNYDVSFHRRTELCEYLRNLITQAETENFNSLADRAILVFLCGKTIDELIECSKQLQWDVVLRIARVIQYHPVQGFSVLDVEKYIEELEAYWYEHNSEDESCDVELPLYMPSCRIEIGVLPEIEMNEEVIRNFRENN